MTLLQSIILAIVEGLTEFLPVSSTGHMILTQGILGMEADAYVRAFTVMIQFGAILSVVVLYYRRFLLLDKPTDAPGQTVARKEAQPALRPESLSPFRQWAAELLRSRLGFYLKLVVGVIPAGVIGLLLEDQIDALLSNVWVVAVMLILGGIFMLFMDKLFYKASRPTVTYRNAFVVGLFQCIAMVPGVSRSMATIVGALQQGIHRKAAAEFSFFLAVPTMLGATLLKGYKLYKEFGWEIFRENALTLITGNVVAFVVAALAIKLFISFLTRYGFRPFGYYRIAVGALVIVLLLCGVPLTVD